MLRGGGGGGYLGMIWVGICTGQESKFGPHFFAFKMMYPVLEIGQFLITCSKNLTHDR